MIRRLLAAVAVFSLCVVVTPDAGAAQPTTLFTIHDPRLSELSGIARGMVSPGVFYAQNDSGDSARFFALDAKTGKVLAEYHVPGATNVDWEDLAVAPDAAGTPSVWLADIGDNDAQRDHVTLYRVDEPHVRASITPQTTGTPDVWQLRYPDGPVNAESLAVSPQGRAYIVTKRSSGRSKLFAVPAEPSRQVRTMTQLAKIELPAHGSIIPASLQRDATGVALSRDGQMFVLRTYTDAYLWPVTDGDLAAAVGHKRTWISLPLQPQGEGVCFDGDRLVLDSEQVGSPVIAVPLPATEPARTSTPTTSSARPAPPTTSPPTPAPSSSAAPSASSDTGSDAPPLLLRLGFGLLIVVGVAGLVAVRRRRRQG